VTLPTLKYIPVTRDDMGDDVSEEERSHGQTQPRPESSTHSTVTYQWATAPTPFLRKRPMGSPKQ
jgi:hypothetical protein